MSKKKVLLLIAVVFLLFAMTGCSIPMDENRQYVLISLNDIDGRQCITSFSQMWQTEGFFSALFVYPLSQLINRLTPISNVGVAILLVAVVINAVLLVLTFKQNVAMQKMQLLQPEIERIQRKYEGKTDQNSQLRMSQEMQRLYSKNHINPFGSLLVTFIQFPVLIAMYHAVQRASSVAQGTFMGISLEVTPLAGTKNGQWLYLVFFLMMVVTQALSVYMPQLLAKQKAKKEAELHHHAYKAPKNPMGASMYIMVGVISIIAINWPTAMSFYWMISNLINIVKTLLIQVITNKQAERGDI